MCAHAVEFKCYEINFSHANMSHSFSFTSLGSTFARPIPIHHLRLRCTHPWMERMSAHTTCDGHTLECLRLRRWRGDLIILGCVCVLSWDGPDGLSFVVMVDHDNWKRRAHNEKHQERLSDEWWVFKCVSNRRERLYGESQNVTYRRSDNLDGGRSGQEEFMVWSVSDDEREVTVLA